MYSRRQSLFSQASPPKRGLSRSYSLDSISTLLTEGTEVAGEKRRTLTPTPDSTLSYVTVLKVLKSAFGKRVATKVVPSATEIASLSNSMITEASSSSVPVPTVKHKSLFKTALNGRFNVFVLIPSTGDLNDEVVDMGTATIKHLKQIHKKSRVCSNIIPIGAADELSVDSLESYSTSLKNEKQLAIEFHIAAHGDPFSIGGDLPRDKVQIEDFAEALDQHFESAELYKIKEFKKKELKFVFHSCNSAYVSLPEQAKPEKIAELIREQSLIGRFAACLKKLGFTNFEIVGFRGYYSHMTSSKGSCVASTPYNGSALVPAEKVKYSLNAKDNVKIPTAFAFPVVYREPPRQDQEQFFGAMRPDRPPSY